MRHANARASCTARRFCWRMAGQQQVSELCDSRAQARTEPTSHAELVEYLLDTEGEEMNFEVARCRPKLTEDFFTYLGSQIGERLHCAV